MAEECSRCPILVCGPRLPVPGRCPSRRQNEPKAPPTACQAVRGAIAGTVGTAWEPPPAPTAVRPRANALTIAILVLLPGSRLTVPRVRYTFGDGQLFPRGISKCGSL